MESYALANSRSKLPSYADILNKYVGAAGKLTRFKGEFHRFRVAFKVNDPSVVKEMRQQGAELYTLVEVGDDYVAFKNSNTKVYLPIYSVVLED